MLIILDKLSLSLKRPFHLQSSLSCVSNFRLPFASMHLPSAGKQAELMLCGLLSVLASLGISGPLRWVTTGSQKVSEEGFNKHLKEICECGGKTSTHTNHQGNRWLLWGQRPSGRTHSYGWEENLTQTLTHIQQSTGNRATPFAQPHFLEFLGKHLCF